MLCPKKVGTLPVEGSDEQKRTNEIGMAIPLLQTCDIEGKDITGETRLETALGITSRTPEEASPKRVLAVNRGHWGIESVHYIIDWNYDEDRSQIRTGFGPENITRLRRFAIGILKSLQKPAQSIAEMMRKLAFNTRLVFDYLRMTQNSNSARAQSEQICRGSTGIWTCFKGNGMICWCSFPLPFYICFLILSIRLLRELS